MRERYIKTKTKTKTNVIENYTIMNIVFKERHYFGVSIGIHEMLSDKK